MMNSAFWTQPMTSEPISQLLFAQRIWSERMSELVKSTIGIRKSRL